MAAPATAKNPNIAPKKPNSRYLNLLLTHFRVTGNMKTIMQISHHARGYIAFPNLLLQLIFYELPLFDSSFYHLICVVAR